MAALGAILGGLKLVGAASGKTIGFLRKGAKVAKKVAPMVKKATPYVKAGADAYGAYKRMKGDNGGGGGEGEESSGGGGEGYGPPSRGYGGGGKELRVKMQPGQTKPTLDQFIQAGARPGNRRGPIRGPGGGRGPVKKDLRVKMQPGQTKPSLDQFIQAGARPRGAARRGL